MPHTWYKVDNVAKVFFGFGDQAGPACFPHQRTLTEEINPTPWRRRCSAPRGICRTFRSRCTGGFLALP